MRAGKLKHKAVVHVPATTTNAYGEVSQGHTVLGTYACSITTKPKRESEEGQALVSKVEFDLRFRYYAQLATLPRDAYIVINGLTLQINAVANIQLLNREIQIVCEERS